MILPRKNWVTKLIIKRCHELGNHIAGTNQILASLSTKFWIIAAREAILEWERSVQCVKKEKLKYSSPTNYGTTTVEQINYTIKSICKGGSRSIYDSTRKGKAKA